MPEVSPPLLLQPALPTALLDNPVAVPIEVLLVNEPALAPSEFVKDTALAVYAEVVPIVLPIKAAPPPGPAAVATALFVIDVAPPAAPPPTGPALYAAFANEPAAAVAAAEPSAAPLPVVMARLETVPLVMAVPLAEAAPNETGAEVPPAAAAAPLAAALEVAYWLLNAVPTPELATLDWVVVDTPTAVVTAAFELVAVATPAASKTANARRLFFMMIPLTYECNSDPPSTVF